MSAWCYYVAFICNIRNIFAYVLCFVSTRYVLFIRSAHWYVCLHAVGLLQCVSLIVVGVLCLFPFCIFMGVCVLLSGVKFV
jgi:hypothetical protein